MARITFNFVLKIDSVELQRYNYNVLGKEMGEYNWIIEPNYIIEKKWIIKLFIMLFTYYISVSYIALYPINNLICCGTPLTCFAYHNFKLIYIICYIYRLSIYIYTIMTIFDIIFSILNSKYPSTIMYIVYIIICLSIRAFSLSSFQIVVHSANSLK